MSLTWPRGAATGVGSLPGTDPFEASRLVLGELPDLPHLPELPGRGPGSDLIGRGAALLTDIHVELPPSGWRLTARPGLDERRARDLLQQDLDALEVAASGYVGPLKLQSAGPWTLAAGLELPRGDRALGDPGARRDLIESLAEGLRLHVAEVARRVPGAQILLQLDEPSMSAVRDGRIPTASGFGAIAAVGRADLAAGLRTVADIPAAVGVHSCADDPCVEVLCDAGVAFVSVDGSRLVGRRDYDALGAVLEQGAHLLLGLLSAVDTDLDRASVSSAAAPVRALGRDLGIPPEELADRVVLTPACGLAGASPTYARAVLSRLREIGRVLAEAPEE